jgi:tRNA threonylcarbamoyladenosine biosynthesis protein TsaB
MSEVPRLLLLETSGRGGFVALARGETLLGVRHLEESRRNGRDLTPMTAELLREQGWRPAELAGVIVSIGPGSYTGLRVGLMAAKMLSYATGCALLGVETFTVIAGQVPDAVEQVDVLADAQQEKVYVQSFRRGGAILEPQSSLRIVAVEEWLANRDAVAHVSGPGVEAYRERLAGLPLIEVSLRLPTPEGLLRLGLRRFLAGERDDVWRLEPIYLRPSAAEEQWDRRMKGY